MSEIFGIACAESPSHTRHEKVFEEQTKIFNALLLQSESNGKDSSGVFFIDRDKDKSKSALFKMDLPSSKLVKRDEYTELVQRFFGTGLRIAMGHCRKASAAAKTSNKNNNHPIATRAIVGTHVGNITNYKKLWEDHGGVKSSQEPGKSAWQIGDVDSEIIFYMLGKQLRSSNSTTFEGSIVEASKELEGTYACAAVDLWRPGYVMLFTNQKEIFYYYSPSLNQVIFSTDFSILRVALESAGFTVLDNYKNSVPPHSGLRINADSAKLRPFLLASEKTTEKVTGKIIQGRFGHMEAG